jgi:molybdenum cofactor cytidylyltransferase
MSLTYKNLMPELAFRPACEADAPLLSRIAAAAKAHWGYPPALMARWTDDLTVTAHQIATVPVELVLEHGEVLGFVMLKPGRTSWSLEHCWVLPAHHRRGIGRALLARAADIARAHQVHGLEIDSDPNAEAFYAACGAVRIGTLPAPIPGHAERVLVRMMLALHGGS